MRNKKNQQIEAVGLNVIQLQVGERTKQEIAFDRSMDDLVDTMRELMLVEQLTGRADFPSGYVWLLAMRLCVPCGLRGAKREDRENDVARICGAYRL